MKILANLREKSQKWFDELARRAPARLTLVIFLCIIAVFSGLLMLPIATAGTASASVVDALFTGTSAVCVSGLTVLPTETYWSGFGLLVIMLGIKIGGLGVMTLASMLSLAVSRHIGLTTRLLAAGEKSSNLGEVGSLVKLALGISLSVEGIVAALFFPYFLSLDFGVLRSAWYSIFMAISVFNNTGFVILPDGMTSHAADFAMIAPIIVGAFIGGLGFPVAMDLRRNWRHPRRLTLHSKLTLVTTTALMAIGGLLTALIEWNNPDTYQKLGLGGKLFASVLAGVNTRSVGISTVDVADMHQSSWFLMDIMMFIGGGTASTAGGIKVTTVAVMVLAIIAEIRGDRDLEAFGRRIGAHTVRLAVAVVAMGALIVGVSTTLMLILTDLPLAQVLFETTSAFGNVGLSTGITPHLPDSAKILLILLMFTGRVGTMTFGAALAVRLRRRVIRYPEESPSIG